MESKRRSAVKALSWRVLATFITMAVTLVVTGRLVLAAQIGLLDTAIKFLIYYLHERAWVRISYGRIEPPDYQI